MTSNPQSENPNQITKITEMNSFIINTLILTGGTSIGALITIVASPILTRYFSPESYGIFAVFSSIVSLISIVACMRYEVAIMLPKSDTDAINILALCLLIVSLLSFFLIPFIWIFQTQIITIFNLPDFGFYFIFIPFMVFINGVFIALFYWNTRRKNFKRLASARISNSLVTNGSQLASAFIGFVTAGALIIGSIFGTFVSTIVLSLQIWREDKVILKKSINWNSIVNSLKRYRNFPIYDSFSVFLNSLSWQLPILMLSSFFSPATAGLYALGFRVLQTPMNLLGGSLSQNFFQKGTESVEQGTLGQLVEQVFEILVIVGLYPILLLTIVGADLFFVIFGPQWIEAGVYAQILSIWVFIYFISSPLSAVFSILEKQEFNLKLNIVIFSTRFISLAIGGLIGDAKLALILFAGTGIFLYGFMNWSIMRFSGASLQFVKKVLIDNSILFIPAFVLILLLKFLNANSYLITFTSIAILVVYYLYILKTNNKLKGIFNNVIRPLIYK
jgi:lipopolysaccharide exporter